MDPYSSGEELVIKTRKPYTITKQRERWTEEEHKRFLEALKLYGRGWQRIEEHIGTKTAVQIRSHAQKFFTKLEKEAVTKGVPVGQTLDIEIPPPRPKRKPSNPYPRKTNAGSPSPQLVAKDGKQLGNPSRSSKQLLDLEKEPLHEKPFSDEKLGSAKGNQDEVNFEVLSLSHGTSSVSKSSLSTVAPSNHSSSFREFVPNFKEVINREEANGSFATFDYEGDRKLDNMDIQPSQNEGICIASNIGNLHRSLEKMVQEENSEKPSQPENMGSLSANSMQANQNYPRHVPVHILDASLGMDARTISPDISCQESTLQKTQGMHWCSNQLTNPAASTAAECNGSAARSSIHQSLPTLHPLFTPIHSNQEDYRSFLPMTSTFSSLVVSALLQNPAAHAAASFAATFWPLTNVETSVDSPAFAQGGLASRQMNSAPSMAALAAATVAAATAWWAAHGMLPLCAPLHAGFTCTPSTTATPVDHSKITGANDGLKEPQACQMEAEFSEALEEQHSASKAPTMSMSDSEESEGAKLNVDLPANDNEQAPEETKRDLNNPKTKKQVDRSSCGSNTTSSSEVETDALEKDDKEKEEPKQPDTSTPSGDISNRRGKSSSNSSDSWKEVSEGGRLAFQALFSRQVLPQSFSPPHNTKNKGHQKNMAEKSKQSEDVNYQRTSQLDLNTQTWAASSRETESNAIVNDGNNGEGLILTVGPGQLKLKARRTGFKPYKRCSMEAKESRMISSSVQDNENGPKRLRLEGGAST